MSVEPGEFRRLLEARRRELQELDRISEGARAPVALDQQSVGRLSRMDAMQQQAMARADAQRRSAELARIAAALARIEVGEYGDCTQCGEPIAEGRLRHDPSAARCIACAK